ncbi:MAG: InlB B-repeat-containing protein, partial [Lachnospiraceae bacterium]|nr:InlB B-repeat-containing protein [Lachnospiraceae bacterium]
NNGGSGNVPNKTYIVGNTYGSLPAGPTPPTGYSFAGWYTAASGGTKINTSSTVSASYKTLYAHYTAKSFKVTFNANGGSTPTASKTGIYNSTYGTLPTPTRTGYTFAGWFTAASGGTKITASSKVTTASNHTLYAHWTAKTFKVTFNANGGSCSTASKTVTFGSTYGTLPTPTRTGYTFAGWFTTTTGGTKITASSKVTTASNHTLYAHWTAKKIKVTLNPNGGSVSPTSVTVTFGGTYGTLPTPTRANYNFVGWFTAASGGTQVTAATKVTRAASHTLYSQWKAQTITITFMDGDKVVARVTIPKGGTIPNIPVPTPAVGHTFVGWYTAKSGGTMLTSSTKFNTDATVYARWKAITVTVSFNSNGGTAAVSKQVTYGSAYGTLPTPTRTGYSFAGWYTAASGGAKVTSTTIVTNASNHTLYAHWTAGKTIQVTFNSQGGSSVSSKLVIPGNTYGTLPTPVRGNYVFAGWYTAASGGTKITSTTTVSATGNHTLYAHWTECQKVLVVNFDPQVTMKDGKKVYLHELMGALDVPEKFYQKWNDPNDLAKKFATAMEEVSYGNAKYKIVETKVLEELPMNKSGEQYTPSQFYDLLVKACNATHGRYWEYSGWRDSGFSFDYDKYFQKLNIYDRVNRGEIDEVWIFAGPCCGTTLNESMMTGKDAFWINGSELVKAGQRNFATYGFNFERGLAEMLEDAGHRMERTMDQVFFGCYSPITEANYKNKTYDQLNDWEKFYANDVLTKGKIVAGVGNVHCGPNARYDYDWNNTAKVQSYCDNWLNYPNITGASKLVDSSIWGSTMEGHHRWWFQHIPHASGSKNGINNNWWYYFKFENLQ